jgi:hypothetical protein
LDKEIMRIAWLVDHTIIAYEQNTVEERLIHINRLLLQSKLTNSFKQNFVTPSRDDHGLLMGIQLANKFLAFYEEFKDH